MLPFRPVGNRRVTTIFAKRPVPGRVKTRLCPPLSHAEAAELALAMLEDTVEKCLACAQFETAIAAEGDLGWFRERFGGVVEVVPQEGGDLGERLAGRFERAGPDHVCIGSDAPQVPASRIAEAHAALEGGADLVLGPDLGGGYYLVGLARPAREIFTQVPMSTPDMCARTIELARSIGLRVHLLETDFDVDRPEDLERLAGSKAARRSAALAAAFLDRRAT